MIIERAKEVYDFYDRFLEDFLLLGDSILTDDKNILNQETLENCFENYVKNFDNGKERFGEKIKEQFKDADIKTRLVFAHAEWLWGFSVNDITQSTKKEITKRTTGITDDALLNDFYPKGFAKAGMYHKNNKYDEIVFVLHLVRFLKQKIDSNEITSTAQIKDWIEKICFYKKYDQETPNFELPENFTAAIPSNSLAVINILLHLSKPDEYEGIVSDTHKGQIVNTFLGLLSDEDAEDENKTTDQKITLIREKISEITNQRFSFYDEKYKKIWNYSSTETSFSEMQGLQYKKAIILYGPPGTGKTHSAKQLASTFITNAVLRKRENIRKYFESRESFTENRIHRLQLHPNYSYEDFIAGIQLRDHNTSVEKGKLFEICESASKDLAEKLVDDIPHVLILDEINRIDLSRLFGEVFSALENRDEPIGLGVGNLKLTIPRNLFVIGTMNEIDFSLERIDFALRRRFLWFFYGFEKDTLRSIFEDKNEKYKTRIKEDEAERFFTNAENLNEAITNLPELGKQFQIGHTFFGEIVNIYKSYKDLGGYKSLQKQLYKKQGAAQILWEISLEPMLKAFLGNMDAETQSEKISELKKIYES